jgi:hypothetical protein
VAGNLLVALAYGSHHNSVGASTATFGALGLLGGLQVVRWLRGGSPLGRRRRVLSIVGRNRHRTPEASRVAGFRRIDILGISH